MAIILVIHVLIAIALVGAILLQKKEGGMGGLGGGAGGLGGLMSGRAKADSLSKATGVLATAFFVTSLVLAVVGSRTHTGGPLGPDTTLEPSAPATNSAPADTPSANTGTTTPAPAENAPAQTTTPAVPAGD
jgi:preprotein translocase subunit SecG